MKENTKKILLMLYPTNLTRDDVPQEKPMLTEEELRSLVPDLSPAGFRSLLFLLEKKDFLIKDSLTETPNYSLSSYGASALEKQFPALLLESKQWAGEWTALVFLGAPKTDKNFRYLRGFLLDQACVSLKRGVFLYPGELTETMLSELRGSYQQNVVALKVKDWLFGDERLIIGQKIELQALFDIYSGISKELGGLIRIDREEKGLSKSLKKQFNSIYDRYLAALSKDRGLLKYYHPQVKSAKNLLFDLQNCLKI